MSDHSLYRPHGQSKIWTEDHLLVVHSRGPWNQQLVAQAGGEVLSQVAKFAGQPWFALGIIYGDGLHTPDAFQEMVNALLAQRQAGRRGTALVLKDVNLSGFFHNYFAKMYAAAGEPVEFFSDEALARQWLAEQIEQLA